MDNAPKPPRFLLACTDHTASIEVLKRYEMLKPSEKHGSVSMKTFKLTAGQLCCRELGNLFDVRPSMDEVVLLYDVPSMTESWIKLAGTHRLPESVGFRPRWAVGVSPRFSVKHVVDDVARLANARAEHVAEMLRAVFSPENFVTAFGKKHLPWGPASRKALNRAIRRSQSDFHSLFRSSIAIA